MRADIIAGPSCGSPPRSQRNRRDGGTPATLVVGPAGICRPTVHYEAGRFARGASRALPDTPPFRRVLLRPVLLRPGPVQQVALSARSVEGVPIPAPGSAGSCGKFLTIGQPKAATRIKRLLMTQHPAPVVMLIDDHDDP